MDVCGGRDRKQSASSGAWVAGRYCASWTHHVEPEMIQYRPYRSAPVRQRPSEGTADRSADGVAGASSHRRRRSGRAIAENRSFGRWSDCIRSAVWWADPDRCDPWLGNAEVKANAQPEQVPLMFQALHNAVGTAQVSAKEIAERCSGDSRRCDSDLAEAVKTLSIPEPKG